MLDTVPTTDLSAPSTGLNSSLTAFDYTIEESEAGFEHFAVVETQVTWMEWYYTHSTGNLRASFDYASSLLVGSRWLAP
jgi:3-hydroxyisobutyrate dehydrogenase